MLAASMASTSRARWASTVSRLASTSAKPPFTNRRSVRSSASDAWITPGRMVEITGACPSRTVKSPSVPGTTTWLASPDSNIRSGVTSSNLNISAMACRPRQDFSRPPALVGAGAGLLVDLLRRLQLGAAERAEEHRVVDGIGLVALTVEAEEPDRHVKDAVVVGDQRLEVLALDRLFQVFTTIAEFAAFALRSHRRPRAVGVMPPRPTVRLWQPPPRSCRPCRTPAPADDRIRRRTDP